MLYMPVKAPTKLMIKPLGDYDTTLFNYAGHTQQKLVSRWGVGKHVRISYVCMDVLKINIFIFIEDS